jgi:hypothetical protein
MASFAHTFMVSSLFKLNSGPARRPRFFSWRGAGSDAIAGAPPLTDGQP